jgi:hypothetical protein
MKKFFFVFLAATLSVTLIPGAAQAASSDTTIYPIDCTTSGSTYVYLAYGVTSITFTNPDSCTGTDSSYVSNGTSATWTFSKTISGTTTSGSYSPGVSFPIGALGSLDSFTLTLTSASSKDIRVRFGVHTHEVYFNPQFETFSPDPVEIGQEVTVTGSNLLSVTSLFFWDSSKMFSATTANRTSTQLTFTVPLVYTDYMGITSNVAPGSYRLSTSPGKTLTVIAAPPPSTTSPGAPTIGTATAISPTSATIAFLAPTSDGGATIETYTATSSPGSITGRVMQAGSGTITMTGLTSSTAYTFTVTASNSVGTSSASSSSVSLTTPASAEEIAAQNAADVVAAASAVKAAAVAAAFQREVEKRSARAEILRRYKNSEKITLELFDQAEILGITLANSENLHADLFSSPPDSRVDISQLLKIARKYEVLGIIASDRARRIFPISLIEAGLIPVDSKYKATLTVVVRKLPASDRASFAAIKKAIDAKMAEIQAGKDRHKAILARIAARRAG